MFSVVAAISEFLRRRPVVVCRVSSAELFLVRLAAVLRVSGVFAVIFILQTCSRLHEWSEKSAVDPEQAPVFGGVERYERRPYESLGSFRIPKPRRAADRGLKFPRYDRGNASKAQILCWKTPPTDHCATRDNCANSLPRPRRCSGPALSAESGTGVTRLSLGRVIRGSRNAW